MPGHVYQNCGVFPRSVSALVFLCSLFEWGSRSKKDHMLRKHSITCSRANCTFITTTTKQLRVHLKAHREKRVRSYCEECSDVYDGTNKDHWKNTHESTRTSPPRMSRSGNDGMGMRQRRDCVLHICVVACVAAYRGWWYALFCLGDSEMVGRLSETSSMSSHKWNLRSRVSGSH